MYNICVVTGTRAEYGLLRPVLQKLAGSRQANLFLAVTGAHLSPQFGNTVAEIEADAPLGIHVGARVDILSRPAGEGRVATARRTAWALEGFTDLFYKNRPDVLLVLGDRYESFAAAQAAALLGVPVAHISGGDVTFGADDDWFRHCITKMAKLHFTSCEVYRRRVIRMGEAPATVYNVGGLGDENIRNMPLMDKTQLEEELGLRPGCPYVLVTFHPETVAGSLPSAEQVGRLLRAIEHSAGPFYIFTMANADAGGSEINEALQHFCAGRPDTMLVSSLGVLRYLSAMKHAALVLGNSSSGVVETPSFGVPCVNVGNRQAGRVMSGNIINCALLEGDIVNAIRQACTPGFVQQAARVKSPYNGGDTSGSIVRLLLQYLDAGELQNPKMFYDGEVDA